MTAPARSFAAGAGDDQRAGRIAVRRGAQVVVQRGEGCGAVVGDGRQHRAPGALVDDRAPAPARLSPWPPALCAPRPRPVRYGASRARDASALADTHSLDTPFLTAGRAGSTSGNCRRSPGHDDVRIDHLRIGCWIRLISARVGAAVDLARQRAERRTALDTHGAGATAQRPCPSLVGRRERPAPRRPRARAAGRSTAVRRRIAPAPRQRRWQSVGGSPRSAGRPIATCDGGRGALSAMGAAAGAGPDPARRC